MEKHNEYQHEHRINFRWNFEDPGDSITAIPLSNFRQLIFDNKWNYVLFDAINEKCIVNHKFDELEEDFESYSHFSGKYSSKISKKKDT